MELPRPTHIIDALHLQARNSHILPTVLPLFDTLDDPDHQPQRSAENSEVMQLLWEQGNERGPHFERLCLTLAKKSLDLTVAINHRHGAVPDEVAALPYAEETGIIRRTLAIRGHSHILYETNSINGTYREYGLEQGSVVDFAPHLTHTLAVLGLYNFTQEKRWAS